MGTPAVSCGEEQCVGSPAAVWGSKTCELAMDIFDGFLIHEGLKGPNKVPHIQTNVQLRTP